MKECAENRLFENSWVLSTTKMYYGTSVTEKCPIRKNKRESEIPSLISVYLNSRRKSFDEKKTSAERFSAEEGSNSNHTLLDTHISQSKSMKPSRSS